MKRISRPLCVAIALLIQQGIVSSADAQTTRGRALFAYPLQGQSLEQENADRGACHDWAVLQTGYDPIPIYAAQQYWGMVKSAPSGASYEHPVFPQSGGLGGALSKAEIRRLNELYDAYLRAGEVCLEARGYEVTR